LWIGHPERFFLLVQDVWFNS